MRVLICGGTGFLGRHIVNALALQDHDPVVRSRHSSPALDFAQCITPEQWLAHDDAPCKVDFWLRNLQHLHSRRPNPALKPSK